jgi:hypothetical protein
VHYNGLTEADVARLEAHFSARQMALLREINQMAAMMQQGAGGKATIRLRAGGYFYSHDEAER